MIDIAENPEELNFSNPFADRDSVSLEEYLEVFKTRINQESERLFITEFIFPLLGTENIKYVIPQYPFLDSEGRSRRIDFAIRYQGRKIALEIDGESYHSEGVVSREAFDDGLNRQNEILGAGWSLLRYSYTQLQSPEWRSRVSASLFSLFRKQAAGLLNQQLIEPNYLQKTVLESLDYYRSKGWKKGIVILPTGTGKTFLSAFDSLNAPGRILFIVHRLAILMQAKEAFEKIYPQSTIGLLTGEERENVEDSKILFASKDSLRSPNVLAQLASDAFDYIIVDEVHHGQAPSYQLVLDHFQPGVFMLGLTATPDRLDRKDIFELFDYQKVFEYSLNDAIENGFLVPYTYYGLKDNIDYTNIRHNGNKYSVADLDRNLIIQERNERIFEEYLLKGLGNKALGFCISIKHAEAMAAFFNKKGIPSCSITSTSPNREELIKGFRSGEYHVAFTVDLFNEGIDFPDLRVLLFLRPTESKTVFFQQLGRGLRLCGGKSEVVIIDFIGNYKKANQIRKFLSGSTNEEGDTQGNNARGAKNLYEYNPKCTVIFEAEVEQILDAQDAAAREITKEDLIEAYYQLSEQLGRKPSQGDINSQGMYRIGKYQSVFGSWSRFLKEIGEHTEFSYHFPQGTHLGHILYVLKSVGDGNIEQTRFKAENVRFSGGYDSGVAGNFQRKVKYMLQAGMEMGLLTDFREQALNTDFQLSLTTKGQRVYEILKPLLKAEDLGFDPGDVFSWAMPIESTVNSKIWTLIQANQEGRAHLRSILLEMDAVGLLLRYLYTIQRKAEVLKSSIYDDFFQAPFVKDYLDRHGLEVPTRDVIIRRIPFLLNILSALGIISQSSSAIQIQGFIPSDGVIRLAQQESPQMLQSRREKLLHFAQTGEIILEEEELSQVRENFGRDFLRPEYFLKIENL